MIDYCHAVCLNGRHVIDYDLDSWAHETGSLQYFKLEEPDNTKTEGILGTIDKTSNDFRMNDNHKSQRLLLRWNKCEDGEQESD